MNYAQNGSGATVSDARNALKNTYGYTTVTQDSHNAIAVRTQLMANRPVFMSGLDSSKNVAHAWVCDGLNESRIKTEYFVEFYTGSSYNTYGCYTPSNPGSYITGTPFYHMNWGWGGSYDSWFYDNNVNPGSNNYQSSRENLYIIP
jgi:streptopain